MTESQPKLKLYYFDMVGKGEPIRLMCAYLGMTLEDIRFKDYNDFLQLKEAGKLPFGQVPLLEVDQGDGKVHHLVQSSAILSYLGKLGGLYPSDPILAAKVDAALGHEADAFTGPTVVTYAKRFGIHLDDEATKKSEDKIKTEVAPRHLASLENLLGTSTTGWIADTKDPSPPDFVWYVRLAFWIPNNAKFYPGLEEYPHVTAFVEKFKALEQIKTYYANKK